MIDYAPETDQTDFLTQDLASYYQSLIGIMQWMVRFRQVDIPTEVSMLSSHLAMPHKGHFYAFMVYLHQHHNSQMIFDLTYPDIDYATFSECKQTKFYGNIWEAVPPNPLEPLGRPVQI